VKILADTTVAANIAFGEQPEAIDMERVRQAAQQSQVAEFIEFAQHLRGLVNSAIPL
jgi:hypothetical protein